MQEFEKQSEIMDMKEEMMSDAIDDAMGDEADEEERYIDTISIHYLYYSNQYSNVYLVQMQSDAVVSQVLDELGLQLTDQLTGLPIASGSLASTAGIAAKGGPQAAAAAAGGIIDADADLQARLNNLRRE